MRAELLDLEYEFDMEDIFVYLMLITVVWTAGVFFYYNLTEIFNWGYAIPFMLLLVFYVVLDDHNDQIKQRNDVKIAEVLGANNYNELMHMTAVNFLHGDYQKK